MLAPDLSAKRRTLPPLREPSYEASDIPWARKDLSGSVMTRVRNRQLWLESLPECLMVCNESARRFDSSGHARAPGTAGKPLSLEYIADRLDTDGACSPGNTDRLLQVQLLMQCTGLQIPCTGTPLGRMTSAPCSKGLRH